MEKEVGTHRQPDEKRYQRRTCCDDKHRLQTRRVGIARQALDGVREGSHKAERVPNGGDNLSSSDWVEKEKVSEYHTPMTQAHTTHLFSVGNVDTETQLCVKTGLKHGRGDGNARCLS